jgi:putative membrane protein
MKHTRIISGALLSAGFFLFACQSETKTPDSEKVANEANDEKIETNTFEKDAEALVKLSSQDQYLVTAADYAAKNANQQQVKKLATAIAGDHNNMKAEIRSLATKKNYNVPDSMSNDYVSDAEEMKKWKKGKEFDTKFVDEVIDEHEKAIRILEECAKSTKDADLKSWCEKSLPGLRGHLEESRKVKGEIEAVYKS